MRKAWGLVGAILLPACAREPSPATGEPNETPEVVLTGLPNAPGGNPLVPDEAMLPYPSDFFLAPDPSTATGRRLAFPDQALPAGVRADLFASHDGFTRAPAILTVLEGGVDPSSLPDVPGSVEPDSPVLLVREDTWSPVPILAELDETVEDPDARTLILRPQIALDPDTGYVVLLRNALRRADGAPHAPVDAFRALRDGIPTDNDAVESMRNDFALFHAALAGLAIPAEDVILGWTFHTRSEAQVTRPALSMHDVMASWSFDPFERVSDVVDGDNRLIVGRIAVPDFLGDDDTLQVGPDGAAMVRGVREVEFLVTIPVTVDAPRPVILFGHGFFSRMEETTWGSLQHALQPWRMSTVSTDFIGFNEDDALDTVAALSGDLDGVVRVVGQQLQSQAHFTALARLVNEQLASAIVDDRGAGPYRPLSADRVVYMGISNGGTQGGVIAATSPVIDTVALVVPGGAWSHMLQRAVQWNTLGALFVAKYPEPVDTQVVLSMVQNLLDPVDVLNHAAYLGDTPHPGRSRKAVTLHMAVGDCQVSNMVTEWVARSAGMGLMSPSARPVWGLEDLGSAPDASVRSALFVYDEQYPPLAAGNVPPDDDNGAHETIRYLPSYVAQVGAFLEDGTLEQVCDGPCDPD